MLMLLLLQGCLKGLPATLMRERVQRASEWHKICQASLAANMMRAGIVNIVLTRTGPSTSRTKGNGLTTRGTRSAATCRRGGQRSKVRHGIVGRPGQVVQKAYRTSEAALAAPTTTAWTG